VSWIGRNPAILTKWFACADGHIRISQNKHQIWRFSEN